MTAPYVGARVRWHMENGTYFGRVVEVDDESGLLQILIEGTTSEVQLHTFMVTVLSAPMGGAK